MSKSILTLDEINLILNSEEPKNTKVYGNLYEVLCNITEPKAISIEGLIKDYKLDKSGQAALTYNKNTLLDNVKGEWYVEADSSEDITKKVRCGLCNTPNKYLFYIKNRLNSTRLNVGSYCMTKFPGIDGYTEYKYHLNKTIRNQKVIIRRTEFHDKIPNVTSILDSANFYFDNLPILLPYNLYYGLKNIIKDLRLIYSKYINYGKKPIVSDKNSFDLFLEYVDKYYKLKNQADSFISQNKGKFLICKKPGIEWMLKNKQKLLLDEIAQNNGIYTKETLGRITSNDFIYRNFQIFSKHNCSKAMMLNDMKTENSQLCFFVEKFGYKFLYIINIKKFMSEIGVNCILDSNFQYDEYDLFGISSMSFSDGNLQNAVDSIADKLKRFGYVFIFDDSTNNLYIYKKSDKSIKRFTVKQFLKLYNLYIIEKSIDVYKFLSKIISKNWISLEEQGRQGIEEKINNLYYHQYIEPYL